MLYSKSTINIRKNTCIHIWLIKQECWNSFEVTIQQEFKGKHGVCLLFIAMPLTFYITREKQPDPQGACINITTISDIEIWSTYIKKYF